MRLDIGLAMPFNRRSSSGDEVLNDGLRRRMASHFGDDTCIDESWPITALARPQSTAQGLRTDSGFDDQFAHSPTLTRYCRDRPQKWRTYPTSSRCAMKRMS
jgi:hypothetical protein